MKDVIISMSLAWDKEKKSESPTGVEPKISRNLRVKGSVPGLFTHLVKSYPKVS